VKVAQGGARMVEVGKKLLYRVPGLERIFKFLKFRKRHSTRDMLFGLKNPILWTPPVLAPKDKTTEILVKIRSGYDLLMWPINRPGKIADQIRIYIP
jgi:hypothetical protein